MTSAKNRKYESTVPQKDLLDCSYSKSYYFQFNTVLIIRSRMCLDTIKKSTGYRQQHPQNKYELSTGSIPSSVDSGLVTVVLALSEDSS